MKEGAAPPPPAGVPPAAGSPPAGSPPAGVELVALPSRRIEVDYAVSRICRWVQEPGTRYRYRDVAVIVRDLNLYHHLLTEALRSRGIPFFIDRRRSTAHHGLLELLRGLVNLAAEQISLESIRIVLKTGLVPLSTEETDELENHLLAHGLSGISVWRGEDWTSVSSSALPAATSLTEQAEQPSSYEVNVLARINRTRRKLLTLLDPWLDFALGEPTRNGATWAAALIRLLDEWNVGLTIQAWSDEAEEDGDLDEAAEHRQVWRDTRSFLDDLAFAFADVELTVTALATVLETGLAGFTLGLAPPMIDQVLVGSIDRSRHPEIKAAVIIGFNDAVFPQQPTEDSILNDDDRNVLTAAGIAVRPASQERVLDERLLVYTALTRASEALVVTYAAADEAGKVLRPSPYVDALCAAAPGLAPVWIADPTHSRQTWSVLSARDLGHRLTMEFRSRPPLSEDDVGVRGRWNELYDGLCASLRDDSVMRHAMGSLGERREASISPASVEQLVRAPLRVSVSQLETYAACPFQHFARYGLKLKERAEATLAPVDVGQVHHAIMEDFVGALSTEHLALRQLNEDDVLGRLEESCSRVVSRLPVSGPGSNARDAYLLRRSTARLARVIQAQHTLAQQGRTREIRSMQSLSSMQSHAVEVPFGFDRSGALPALELSTPAGRRVFLRGYIDRVDLAELGDELLGVIVDYKRTRDKRLNMDEVYHGLSLQLLGYLLVVAEFGETLAGRPVRPAAALYVSLTPKYERVDHPGQVGKRQAGLPGAYRPRGIIASERFDVLDASLTGSGWSSFYAMYRKADGTLGYPDKTDGADDKTMAALMEHTKRKLGELADGILDGQVAVKPYRLGTFSPCSWCPMASVCRFEMGLSDVRFLETLTRSQVFAKLTGSRD